MSGSIAEVVTNDRFGSRAAAEVAAEEEPAFAGMEDAATAQGLAPWQQWKVQDRARRQVTEANRV